MTYRVPSVWDRRHPKEDTMTIFLWIVYWIAFVVLAVAVFIVDRSEHWTEEQRKRYGLGPRGQGR